MSDSIVSRGLDIFLEEGPEAFLRAALKSARKRTSYLFWRAHGAKPIRADGHTISVSITDYGGDYWEVDFFEKHEREEATDLLGELEANDTFFDVGSNIGIYALFAEHFGGEVYAIEPDPVNLSHLLVNRERNSSEITVVQCALSDSEGYIEVAGPRRGLLADGSVAISDRADRDSRLLVWSEPGDALVEREGIHQPNVIKIDVEGAESRVIDGLRETLKTPQCRLVYCEVHEEKGVRRETIEKELADCGFEVNTIGTRKRGVTVKARKRSDE